MSGWIWVMTCVKMTTGMFLPTLHMCTESVFLKRCRSARETDTPRERRRSGEDRATLSPVICHHLFPLLTKAVIENTFRMCRKTFLSTQTHTFSTGTDTHTKWTFLFLKEKKNTPMWFSCLWTFDPVTCWLTEFSSTHTPKATQTEYVLVCGEE